MTIVKRMNVSMIWLASLACFIAGLYVAIDHTMGIFTYHNYAAGPIGDEAVDAAKFTYPILTGEQPFMTIFKPFADHRVVLARIQEMFDFIYTQGIQTIQPYRLALLIWLQAFLFITFVIVKNPLLNRSAKILLTGTTLSLAFAGMSIMNYSTTMMVTWPYILVFSLLSFITTQKYCESLHNNDSSIKAIMYMTLTFLFVTLAVLTFNIGLIIWPIVFIILIKQNCFKKYWYLWSFALITYPLYFRHWAPPQGKMGLIQVLKHPIQAFLYMSRILSLPIVPTGATTASVATATIALFILCFSLIFLYALFKKKHWSTTDGILFPYYLFGLIAIGIISSMRFFMEGEAANIGLRFTTPSFIIMGCLLVSLFSINVTSNKDQLYTQAIPYMITMVWLLSWFIPTDPFVIYDANAGNQLLISQAIVPIDEGFIESTRSMHNSYDVRRLNYLNDVQKQYKKGVYAFWSSQYINHSIDDLKFKQVRCFGQTDLSTSLDFRQHHNPGLFINITVKDYLPPLTKSWQILFTNASNTIIGFGLPGPAYISLIDRLKNNYTPFILFRGAINTDMLNNVATVTTWAADNQLKQICKLGSINV